MTRIGKIARLPRAIRDQLNHRMQDGESCHSLVTWLNAQPEVQKVLADSFGGRPVDAQNLSDWKQGGYQHWLARQDTLELACQMGEQATDLQTGDQRPLTNLLTVWLTARYATAIKDIPPPASGWNACSAKAPAKRPRRKCSLGRKRTRTSRSFARNSVGFGIFVADTAGDAG